MFKTNFGSLPLFSFFKRIPNHIEPSTLKALYFRIRLGIWIVTFSSTIISFFFENWPSAAVFAIFPTIYLLLLCLLLKNKNEFLLALPHLIMLFSATLIVLQEGTYYLRMLTSCLGFVAIYSVQAYPFVMQVIMAGGYLWMQRRYRFHLNNVYEPITNTYRISAPAVNDALDGWATSLVLEVLSLIIYQIIVKKVWNNYQEAKRALEQANTKLKEANDKLARNVIELDQMNRKLEQVLESQSLFVACVSHELRNPLNVLFGNIELLESDIRDHNQSQLLKNCKMCGELLLGHINNLLDVAKINAGKVEINPSLTKMSTFLERVWTLVKVRISKKGLMGYLSVDKKLPLWLNIDADRLHQIFENLISNAIKFTATGSIRVNLQWILEDQQAKREIASRLLKDNESNPQSPVAKANPKLANTDEKKSKGFAWRESLNYKSMSNLSDSFSFSNEQSVSEHLERFLKKDSLREKYMFKIDIIDSGCGITEDEQKTIFDPFIQADRSVTRKYGGTGLGLYITKRLVEKMGGTLKLFSLKNIGTHFQILLPVKYESQPEQQVETIKWGILGKLQDDSHANEINKRYLDQSSGKKITTSSQSKKALIVDDDHSNQLILRMYFKKLGIEADTTDNGLLGLKMYKDNYLFYAFIAMDIQMPEMDGITAAKQIRRFERDNHLPKIPIVFITGNCSEDEQKECQTNKEIGNSEFFRKPFRFSDCEACFKRINLISN